LGWTPERVSRHREDMSAIDPAGLKSHSKLFGLLDDAGQRRLLAVAHEERHPVGAAVVTESDFGDTFYVVLEGTLSVRIGGIDAKKEVATLGPGAFFGEIAALLGEARSATVLCLSSVRVLRFDGPRVQGILKDYPKVREVLVKLGLKRSEENLQQQLEDDFPGVPVTTGEGPPVMTGESSVLPSGEER
jgi:CRP-like cAMP-binding protein